LAKKYNMKKSILLTTCLIFYTQIVFGQCDNNVSTNPFNPSNNELPDIWQSSTWPNIPTPPFNQDSRYLNGLNWWSPNNYPLSNMFYNPTQPYTVMQNIQSAQIIEAYYTYLKKGSNFGEEMNPPNGWELLLVNLGRYPDNITLHNYTDLDHVPYLVFYNRYRGIVRVFVKYGYNALPEGSVDGVKINLYYNNTTNQTNLSGQFRLGQGIDRALDQKTNTYKMTAIANLYPNPTKEATTVSYNITEFAEVTLFVTDLMGRKVLEPQLPTMQDRGNYEVQMNTSALSKGIYLCSVKVGNQIKTKRLIIQ
jgi:hypothetical protein